MTAVPVDYGEQVSHRLAVGSVIMHPRGKILSAVGKDAAADAKKKLEEAGAVIVVE